jgi:hypothetical protein
VQENRHQRSCVFQASRCDDVLAIIKARCPDLTDVELSLVLKVPAIEGPPKPRPVVTVVKSKPKPARRPRRG